MHSRFTSLSPLRLSTIATSSIVHAVLIGSSLFWFWTVVDTTPPVARIHLDLACIDEVPITEPEAPLEVVEEPTPLADHPLVDPVFEEVVVEEEPEPEVEEVLEDVADWLEPEPPVLRPEEWMQRIKPAKVVFTPPPEATPVVPEPAPCQVLPTPIVADNEPPRYPRPAIRMGISGTVLLKVEVDADGLVVQCELERSSGSRLLDAAAMRAVRKWRFRDGPGIAHLPVIFSLTDSRLASR